MTEPMVDLRGLVEKSGDADLLRGLSPRVRGNAVGRMECQPSLGPIFACAGEPLTTAAHRGPGRAYPRTCGGTF